MKNEYKLFANALSYLYTIKHDPDVSKRPEADMWHLHARLVVDVGVAEQLGARLVEQKLNYHGVDARHYAAVVHVGIEAT